LKAVYFQSPGRLSVDEVSDPTPGPGEVVVAVDAALTCGTDLKAYLRGHRLFKPPMPFGHELVGHVSALGPGVRKVDVGDRVGTANSAPCGACYYCRRGQTSLCDELDGRLMWGAYADFVRVPAHIVEQNLYPIAETLPDVDAAALEPLACVVHGVDAAAVEPGDTVVILGATGAIGLMFVQVLRQAGAATVIAVGRSSERLALARELGTDFAVPPDDALERTVRGATGGRGADVVVDATGLPDVWEVAPSLARRGGRVVMFGGCPGGSRFSLDTGRLHYEELTVRGVFHHTPATVERALALLIAGRVRIAPLIGAEGTLDDVESLLQRMARREIVKAVVRPAR
jgi:L-iditol 2-dehydrogenase